jgi:Flp pilus assembly pilin Flp
VNNNFEEALAEARAKLNLDQPAQLNAEKSPAVAAAEVKEAVVETVTEVKEVIVEKAADAKEAVAEKTAEVKEAVAAKVEEVKATSAAKAAEEAVPAKPPTAKGRRFFSGLFGLIGIFSLPFGLILGIISIILAKSAKKKSGKGNFALTLGIIALIVGILSVAVIAYISYLAIANPDALKDLPIAFTSC